MAKESDKFEIDDIKDPLDALDEKDVDLEEAVAEEPDKKETPEVDQEDEKTEEPEEVEAKAEDAVEPDELEKAVAEDASAEEATPKKDAKPEKPKKDKKPFPWKTVAIVVITFLVTAALVLAGIYLYQKYAPKQEETKTETPTTNNVQVNVTKPVATQKTVYVTAQPTLNLRKDPNSTAQILTTIPYGTKLNVLATQGSWYQVTYNSQTGWVDSTYTTAEDPLVYKNTDYKFQITFPSDWAGYKITTFNTDTTATTGMYISLPTSDSGYGDTTIGKGYFSMFALSIYTPDQWSALQKEDVPKPTLVTQNQQWVIAWSHPQNTPPADLTAQSKETSSVVGTIKFY